METSIAICVPIRNGEQHLEQCLQSIAQQSLPPTEVILVDNASEDASLSICHAFAKGHPDLKIKVYHFDELVDMASNWNRAIERVTSEYVKVLPCDDLLEPDCLELQIQPFLRESGIALVVSGKQLINHAGKRLMTICRLHAGRHDASTMRSDALSHPTNRLGEPGSGLFMHRDYLQTQGFCSDFSYFVDVEFWFRLLSGGDLWVIDKPLYSFRIHPGGTSAGSRKKAVEEFIRMNRLHGNPSRAKLARLKLKAWLYSGIRSILIKILG